MLVGRVQEIGRFPVKSMLGESPGSARLQPSGLAGDRAYAVVDVASGKVASAKHPRAWGGLLSFGARHVGDVGTDDAPIVITLPDGRDVRSDASDVDAHLSDALGRAVQLHHEAAEDAAYDYVWEVEDIAPSDVVTGSQTGTTPDGHAMSTMPLALMAPGTFQDVAPVTILTTAALAAMAEHHPDGDWHPARFRPNLLLDVAGNDVVENEWMGRHLGIGDAVLEVTVPSPRCVMTTLPQRGLPRDRSILTTVAKHNRQEFGGFGRWACLGAYASVVIDGELAVGDAVHVLEARA